MLGVIYGSCTEIQEGRYVYDKNDTGKVRLATSFTGASRAGYDSLFDDFLSDIIDKSELKLQQSGTVLCIDRLSKNRSAFEAVGKTIKLGLQNNSEGNEPVCTISVNGRKSTLSNTIAFNASISGSAPDTLKQAYQLNCKSIRKFSFRKQEYIYFNMNVLHCTGSGCAVVYHVLYDAKRRKHSVFKTVGLSDYFTFGNINGDDRLDFAAVNEISADGFTDITAYTQNNDGSFSILKNRSGEAMKHSIEILRDDDSSIYIINVWEKIWNEEAL